MRLFIGRWICRAIPLFLFFFGLTVSAATIGTVVPIIGQVTDLVYDANRNLVYLANSSRNQVEVYSMSTGRLGAGIPTGLQPSSLALSLDGNTLYVANAGSLTITVVNLVTQSADTDLFIGSRPDAIAVGNDGQILILGAAGLQRVDPGSGRIQTVPISPPVNPPAGLPIPGISAAAGPAGLITTANGNLIIGLSGGALPLGQNRLFVYEVASGTVLRSRNVSGLRAILSAAPNGSRFMAGPFLFDTQTMAILGRTGTPSPTLLNGGSVFSPDGNEVYATFCGQTPVNPLNTNTNPQSTAAGVIPCGIILPTTTSTQSVLQVMRSSSLTPELGLRIPEPITSKIISTPDGSTLFANSLSGLSIIPVGQLGNLPILEVSTTNVVLSVDACNRTIATATVQIRNAGGGRMTFSASVNNPGGPVILNQRTGIAPATLNIAFDPQRVAVRGTQQYAVFLASPEAVNVEPAILVNLNFREVTDRGTIVPMNGVGVDIQMDAPRQRMYIANYMQDQIEVFSLANQTFLSPIRVGNRPISMAMVNPSTLVVANSGAENLSIVDLDLMAEVDQIGMGPIALNATPLFPHSVAASANAILFSAIPLAATPGGTPGFGSMWQLSLVTHSAFPRLNLGVNAGVTAPNSVNGRNLLTAAGDGSGIAVVEGTGTLRLYDPIADTFVVTRTLAITTGVRGTASVASDGSFYVVDNSVFNSVLVSQGSLVTTTPGAIGPAAQATLALGVAVSGNNIIRIQNVSTLSAVQTLQRINPLTLQPSLQLSLPESVMDINLSQIGVGLNTRLWPPRPIAMEIGVLTAPNQTMLLPRGIVADSNNNAYLFTYSGLTIVSMTPTTGLTPSFSANGVVNRASGSRLISPGSLVNIRGFNLALDAQASAAPLPRSLGGICVTANEVTIPLISTSPTEIQAQLPPELPPGRVTLTVRSTRLGVISAGVQVQVTATGPGVFSMDIGDGQQRALLFHAVDGALVIPVYPADRDEVLVLYTTGLGPADPVVPAGQINPGDPLSPTTGSISVTIGGQAYPVIWAGLAPGFVGVYQINLYVPGDRVTGDNLPVVVTAGSTSNSSSGDPPPLTSVE